ncbi:MAG: serine/threonine protein kinase [Desertifilum sp.]|nr:serine/threonine protein kinase [Desertifilum sp.]
MVDSLLLNHRYRIIRSLGVGGFGETFLAEDTQMPSKRRCAIKQLKPILDNPQADRMARQRFTREATVLERLGELNPQIPQLYAYFQDNGYFYLVQEWIEGLTLSQQVLLKGIFSENAVRRILLSLLAVLQQVHSQQIVHRDIKPDNIILRQSDGQPVLIDFGAVKEAMGTHLSPQGQYIPSIVIGTPGYMPAEQALGRPIYSSDLYSLGLTAIYLLTGKTPQQLSVHPATHQIQWRRDAPQVSAAFASVLDRAIQPVGSDRFYTASQMLQALLQQSLVSIGSTRVISPSNNGGDRVQRTVSSGSISRLQFLIPLSIAASIWSGFFLRGIISTPLTQVSSTPLTVQPETTDSSEKPPVAASIPTAIAPETEVRYPISTVVPEVSTLGSEYATPVSAIALETEVRYPISEIVPDVSSVAIAQPILEQTLDEIADRIFYERYPQLQNRKIQPHETALIQEWHQIRQCEAIVDYHFYQKYPEQQNRKIVRGEKDLHQ